MFYLFAAELCKRMRINLFNVKNFTSLCDLIVEFLNLLGEGLLVLFLGSGNFSYKLLFLQFLLMILLFALLELL